jgi:hypothetical protein
MAETKDKGEPAKAPEKVEVVPAAQPVVAAPAPQAQPQVGVDALAQALRQAMRSDPHLPADTPPPPSTTIRPGGMFRVNDRLVDAEGRPVDPNKPPTPPTPNQSQFPPPPGV